MTRLCERLLKAVAGALLVAFPAMPGSLQANPSQVQDDLDVAHLQASRDRYERMTVPVFVNGEGPFRFMIDTGSQVTILSTRIAEQLAISGIEKAHIQGVASAGEVPLVRLEELRFADTSFEHLQVPLLEAKDIGADGILGLDSLRNHRVLLDFRADRVSLALEREDRSGYEIVVRARERLGRLLVSDSYVDGVRTTVIIDTGSQLSFGNASLARRLRRGQPYTLTSHDVLGAEISSEVREVAHLAIGGLKLAPVRIGFYESPVFAALGLDDRPALILGIENLRKLDRMMIDIAGRRVLFDVSGQDAARSPIRLGTSASRVN